MRVYIKREIICGVYLMTSKSGYHYIGATKDCLRRWSEHVRELRRGVHYLKEFSKDAHKGTLSFFVLQICDLNDLHEHEQKWMNKFPDRINRSRNVTNKGCSTPFLGNKNALEFKMPKSAIEKIRLANLGHKVSPELVVKMQAGRELLRRQTFMAQLFAIQDARKARLENKA